MQLFTLNWKKEVLGKFFEQTFLARKIREAKGKICRENEKQSSFGS